MRVKFGGMKINDFVIDQFASSHRNNAVAFATKGDRSDLFDVEFVLKFVRFFNEKNILDHLQCPQIIKPIDYFIFNNIYVIVEKKMKCDLKTFLINQEQSVSFETFRTFAYDALTAVSYLHKNNIVHGSISTHHFLVSENGTHLQLCDFSCAKIITSSKIENNYKKCYSSYSNKGEKNKVNNPSMDDDVCQLGEVLKSIWNVTERTNESFTKSLSNILNEMTEKDIDNRPSSEQCLERIQKISDSNVDIL